MLVLFTDYGWGGPYVGQLKAVLLQQAPQVPIVDLMHNVPSFNAQNAAYLLAAYSQGFPASSVFLCIVDPEVGSDRRAAVIKADDRWYVAPDNGLLNVVASRAKRLQWWDIDYRPAVLSNTFHGRDLFAPVAARLAQGETPELVAVDPKDRLHTDWPSDLGRVLFIDTYGNAVTGIRSSQIPSHAVIDVSGKHLQRAQTFSDVAVGEGFWYQNSSGLVEIAVNQGHAYVELGIEIGDSVQFVI